MNDDPIVQLERSHRRLEEACDALARAAADHDIETASDVCAFFGRQVRRHEEDEERSLFPRLVAPGGADFERVLARLAEQHREHEALYRRLEDAVSGRFAGDVWEEIGEVAALLGRACRDHIDEEERTLFPLARRVLDPGALAAIRSEMDARRGRARS